MNISQYDKYFIDEYPDDLDDDLIDIINENIHNCKIDNDVKINDKNWDFFVALPMDIKKIVLFNLDFDKFVYYTKHYTLNIGSYDAELFMKKYNFANYLSLLKNNFSCFSEMLNTIKNKIFYCCEYSESNHNTSKVDLSDVNKLKNYHAIFNIRNLNQLNQIKEYCDEGKISIYWMSFHNRFDRPINNLIPKVNTLLFRSYFNQKLYNTESVTQKDTTNEHPNTKNIIKNIPETVQHLEFGYYFNKKVEDQDNKISYLPLNLKILIFGHDFCQNIQYLPFGVEKLYLSDDFVMNVDNLPNSIIDLHFGNCFNKSINKLPSSIRYLTLGTRFNGSMDHIFKFVTHLTIHTCSLDSNEKLNIDIPKHITVNHQHHVIPDKTTYKWSF